MLLSNFTYENHGFRHLFLKSGKLRADASDLNFSSGQSREVLENNLAVEDKTRS